MAFDVGAGFAAMGEAVSKTAGVAAIEEQRAVLDKEKVLLADQLAGEREEKGRQFTAGENEKQRGWQSGENTANRQNSLDVAKIGLEGHKVSAGATVAAATISAKSHLEGIQKQLDALEPERAANVEAKKVETAAKNQLVTARNDYLTALEKGDLNAQTKALQKLAGVEFSPKDLYTEASLYQTQARLFEQAMTSAQTKLATLQANPMTSQTEAGKQAIAALEAQVKMLQGQFQTSVRSAQDALKRLPNSGAQQPQGGRPPLTSFDKGAAAAPVPGVTPATPPGGLINSPE